MDPERQKEEFSNAFVQAISAAAGFSASRPSVDDDSVDWVIAQRGGEGTIRSPRLELQLKSSSSIAPDEGRIPFPLSIKNYDDLRAEHVMVPRILVVVLLPASVEDWCVATDESLLLRRCGYWVSLRGLPGTNNATKKTVDVPTHQRFDVAALGAIMNQIAGGGRP